MQTNPYDGDEAVTQQHEAVADAIEPPIPPEELGDEWEDEPEAEFLPPRPRGRLLRPLTVILFVVLAASAGFLVGVIVEKNQVPASTGATGGAGRLAALLRGGGATGASAAGGGGSGGFSSLFGGGSGSGSVVGQVSTVDGDTLYVTETASGNTVAVKTSPSSTITKSVKTDVHSVHPGDTVVVAGVTASDGTVTASTIRDSGASSSGGGGGAASLFGGGTSSSSGSGSAAGGTGSSGGGASSLFGPG